jgi:hypothetical protein
MIVLYLMLFAFAGNYNTTKKAIILKCITARLNKNIKAFFLL